MIWLRAFIAGYAATLTFHQGTFWLLNLLGFINKGIYNTSPVAPYQIPAILSLAFWGGIWGMLLYLLLRKIPKGIPAWGFAIVFGAIAPSLVALSVVLPLKGGPFMAGWNINILVSALLVNAAWGWGTKYFIGK